MDVLKDTQTRSYDNGLSRYATFPFSYNTLDDKYIYSILKLLDENVPYFEYKTVDNDSLDAISFKYYGRPDYYWIIAMYNNILDVFADIHSQYPTLRIPSLSSVKFK